MQTIDHLSRRELECLYHAAQDKSCYETAVSLSISPETVKTHRKMILRKLGCRTIAGALIRALKEQLISF